MIMVGNKSDLEYERAVSEQEGMNLAQQLKVCGSVCQRKGEGRRVRGVCVREEGEGREGRVVYIGTYIYVWGGMDDG